MDFKKELERGHSKELAEQIAHRLIAQPNELKEYVQFLKDESLLAQRASWPLSTITDAAPDLLQPFHQELLDAAELNLHPAVQRNVFRYFQSIQLDNAFIREQLLDLAFRQMESPNVPIAIRVFAMQIIETNSHEYRDLRQALADSIALRIEDEKPGFRSRGRKILKKLEGEGILPS